MKNKIEKERKKKLNKFQKKLKIKFKNLNLLNKALTHSSYAHEVYNNEEHNLTKAIQGTSVTNPVVVVTGSQLPQHIKRVLDLYRVL